MKPDKLPYLDPCERGIFDRIIAAAAAERLRRRSHEYKQAEERREQAAKALRDLKAREAREAAAELVREQAARKEPVIMQERPVLSLRPPLS